MSITTVIPCGCCRELVEPAVAYLDKEIRAYVCEECRVELRAAQAQLSRAASAPADGLAAMQINLRGCTHDPIAGDNSNRPLIP